MDCPLRKTLVEIASDRELAARISDLDYASPPSESLRVVLGIVGGGVAVIIEAMSSGTYRVGISGEHAVGRKWCHDAFVTASFLTWDRSGREIQVLKSEVPTEEVTRVAFDAIRSVLSVRGKEEAASFDRRSIVPMYWSSGLLNMGDWIGPHIVHQLTGRVPIQSDRVGIGERRLYTVGSIFGWIQRNNVDVWGSGLIEPLSNAQVKARTKLSGIQVHAVRGKLTRDDAVAKLGWEIPEVYGDPALLLPRFFPGSSSQVPGSVAVIPHHSHHSALQSAGFGRDERVNLVNVKWDVRTVIESVSSASVVVASALHGIILAQAYGVPWVWLRIEDKPMWGADFKFEDFFSTLDRDNVAMFRTTVSDIAQANPVAVATRASLPASRLNLDSLLGAFPVDMARGPA